MPPDSHRAVDPDDVAGVFDLLSDETRLRIVRELYRHAQCEPGDPGLGFSALGKRVDVDDTGRFNYHLRRLRGPLVEKRDQGYVLTPLGYALGPLVLEGTPGGGSVGPTTGR